MRARILGLAAAVLIHGFVLLFGGLFLPDGDSAGDRRPVETVELVAEKVSEEEREPENEEPDGGAPAEEPLRTEPKQPPDMREILEADLREAAPVPALDALSLGALEGLLDPGLADAEVEERLGVRVIVDGAWGFASSAYLSPDQAEATAALARGVRRAPSIPKAPRIRFSDSPTWTKSPGRCSRRPRSIRPT